MTAISEILNRQNGETPSSVLCRSLKTSALHMMQRTEQAYVYGGKTAWVYRASAEPDNSTAWAGWNVMHEGRVVARGFQTQSEAHNWTRDYLEGRALPAPEGLVLEIPAEKRRTAEADGGVIRRMSCREFMRLAAAAQFRTAPWDPAKIREWQEWPYLWVDTDTAQVHAHEGRHRVAAMRKAGFLHLDVVLFPVPDPSRDLGINWVWNGFMGQHFRPEDEWLSAIGMQG